MSCNAGTKLRVAVLGSVTLITTVWGQTPAEPPKTDPRGEEFFETRVRPVLATKCAACHTQAESAGLRTDSREALIKGGMSGTSLVPGDPDKSLLIQAVRQTGEIKMPKGGHLKKQEIDDLAEWVKMGAPWPAQKGAVPVLAKATGMRVTPENKAFWSFRPLAAIPAPEVKEKSWPKNEIDRFILSKLEHEGLKPVHQADRHTLIRRATLDLTGIPPTPAEIEAFEKDKSPGAFAKVVDRLLASPQYGERWGRHWLDVVRYGEDDVRGLDPKGRDSMPFNGAYVYRDWVIQAFNNDMPFDLFAKAQIAGDLLDPKLREKTLPGTALLGQGPWWWDQAEPVQGRADERNERIDMVTRGFLGLTVACARCHDHKYDPIPQKDYYALAGVFASTTYKEYPVASAAEIALWQKQQKKIDDAEDVLKEFLKTEARQEAEILAHKTAKYMVAAWRVSGEPKMPLPQAASEDRVDAEILERWVKFLAKPQKHFPYLNDWQAMIKTGGTLEQAQFLAADFEAQVLSVLAESKELKEENDIIKAKAGVKKKPKRDAYPNEFETKDQFCPGCDLELKTGTVDRTNLYLIVFEADLDSENTQFPDPGLLSLDKGSLERHLSAEAVDHVTSLKAQIETLKKDLPQMYPFVHGAGEGPVIQNVHLNLRGSPYSLGDEVPRHFLTVLSVKDPSPFTNGSGRAELADAVVQSPLMARVLVNRVWKWHFGSGIVDTPSNFGKMGERPSNPELLEHLANQFVTNGMSIKKLHREILLSSTYQLSSEIVPENAEKDAANRGYWRANRLRLDAEAIRDSLLAVSGSLDLKKSGGPSTDFADDNFRRTVYCKVSRFRLDNYLQVFDFPNPSFTGEQRFVTNVPLQRLFFMNSTFVYKQANVFAKRIWSEPNDEARITAAYRLLFGRTPTAKETEIGLEFLRANPDKPGQQIEGEPSTAWKQYARVLLSSNEFEFVN